MKSTNYCVLRDLTHWDVHRNSTGPEKNINYVTMLRFLKKKKNKLSRKEMHLSLPNTDYTGSSRGKIDDNQIIHSISAC